jgi:type IV pilus assembly protein PilV
MRNQLTGLYMAHSRQATQRGFTMVEVLVAVLVLAIGLIGLASLQGVSLQFNNSAYLRSQATNLAYDMADRVRANRRAALTTGAYNLAVGDATPAPGSLAETDLNEWRTALQNNLPAGNGGVQVTLPGETLTIVVCWDDSRGAGADGAPAACGGLMGFRFETVL